MDRQVYLKQLKIPSMQLDIVNNLLLNPDTQVVQGFLEVVEKYGTPEEINRLGQKSGELSALMAKVADIRPEYLPELEWLKEQRDRGAFISISDYRKKVLGRNAGEMDFREDYAVTLEISACQYFPWLMDIARQAVK